MSTHRFVALMALVAISCVNFSVSAETILVDDFTDGDATGWIPLDLLGGQPGGPGIYDASSGSLNIRSTDVVPAEVFGPIAALWAGSEDPAFSNGILRATVRPETAGTATNVLMRFGMTESGPGGYFIGMGTPAVPDSPDFALTVVQGNEVLRFVPFDIPGVTVSTGEDWIVELGALGDEITVKAWPASGAEPDAPQIVVTDTTYRAGMFGVGAFRDPNFLFEDWRTSGTFDDISFTQGFPPGILENPGIGGNIPSGLADGLPSKSVHAIPEPAAAVTALLGICILSLVGLKKCRRRAMTRN